MFTYSLNLKLKTDRNFFGPGVVEVLQKNSANWFTKLSGKRDENVL